MPHGSILFLCRAIPVEALMHGGRRGRMLLSKERAGCIGRGLTAAPRTMVKGRSPSGKKIGAAMAARAQHKPGRRQPTPTKRERSHQTARRPPKAPHRLHLPASRHPPGRCGAVPSAPSRPRPLEEAQRIDVVAHQQVLGLLIVVEHHFVSLATHTGFLVAAERRVRRV